MKSLKIALISFALLLSSTANSTLLLDQSNEVDFFQSQAGIGFGLDAAVAQTVQFGKSGQLSRVDFWANNNCLTDCDNPLLFEIWSVSEDGFPSNSLAQVAIDGSEVTAFDPIIDLSLQDMSKHIISVDLTSFMLEFEFGDFFAFSLSGDGLGVNDGFGVLGRADNAYSDGNAFLRRNDLFGGDFYPWNNSGSFDNGDISVVDLGFRTYVSTVPEPSIILLFCAGLIGLRVVRLHKSG